MNIITYNNGYVLYSKDAGVNVSLQEVINHVKSGGKINATDRLGRDMTNYVLLRVIRNVMLKDEEIYAIFNQEKH